MKPKSVKAKGRALQNLLRDKLREKFIENWTKMPKLRDDDIKSQRWECLEKILYYPQLQEI